MKRLLSTRFQTMECRPRWACSARAVSLLNNMVDISEHHQAEQALSDPVQLQRAGHFDFLREMVHLVKRSAGYNVICEGHRDRGRCNSSAQLDCDSAQGFWFSKAIPAVKFEQRHLCD